MADVKFMAESVERRPTDALVPYARNARTHSPEQVGQIAASMREFGWTYPVLVDEDDGIIAGHGRVLAAQKLKLAEVPVMVARGWSEAQKRAYVLADNRIALSSGWDEGLLRVELGDLKAGGFDLSLTGFSSLDLTKLFSTTEGATDPDDVPDALPAPVSQLGDLWLCGAHRILCGDCTSKEDVERLLAGRVPHLCSTDQPYGVSYDPAWRSTDVPQVGKFRAPNRAHGAVQNDERADWREAWALFPGDVIYVWHDGANAASTQVALESCGFEVRSQIIWRKQSFAVGRGHYHWAHESCLYAVRKGKNGHWQGSRKQSTVWDIEAPKRADTGHGTQKPVEAMARPMLNNSEVGDLIYDPFLGSGSALIGAHMNKRIALGCEISPMYIDTAIIRWEKFTGEQAVFADTGETFAQTRERRRGKDEAHQGEDVL